jgi:glycosyltransferase involved in cell wall biosynthesis
MPNFPAAGIVPTIDRAAVLVRTLRSLLAQDLYPQELIVIDASCDTRGRELIDYHASDFTTRGCRLIWQRAVVRGAATQRNEGIAATTQPFIWFFDDDILLEPQCVSRLWTALQSDPKLGGVNAMIVNQRYQPPGRVSRFMFRMMVGRTEASYAGRVLGPAINLLPEDRDDLPDVVPVEWLNTTCTMYRREALPDPVFPAHFAGYSLGEDLTLSLLVGRRWKLANARTARIIHDSQPGVHKDNPVASSRMAVVNRHYIMVDVLRRRGIIDHVKFAFWELFQTVTMAVQQGLTKSFWQVLWGKILGAFDIAARAVKHQRSSQMDCAGQGKP